MSLKSGFDTVWRQANYVCAMFSIVDIFLPVMEEVLIFLTQVKVHTQEEENTEGQTQGKVNMRVKRKLSGT